MNNQTRGPLIEQGNRLMAPLNPSVTAIPARLNDADEWEHRTPENAANARLLAAAYTAFDEAGRALGVDAAELAELIDLAEVIRYALDYAQLNTTAHDLKNVGRTDQTDHARRTLAPLAALMGVKLPL